MTDKANNSCSSAFDQAAPPKPWAKDLSVGAFEPLIGAIDKHTQSDLFRRIGPKYEANGDYYDLARELDGEGKTSGETRFANGVTAQVEQSDGWPTKLVLEDRAAGVKETVTLNETSHIIETDKVEYCGVSRLRKFSTNGETFRSYGFAGGSVEKSGALPVLHLDQK